jgi:monofunctional glycosyltransferase
MSEEKTQKKKKRPIFGILLFPIKLLLIYTAFVAFLILFFRLIHPPTTAFIYSDVGEPIKSLFSTDDINHQPVSFDKMSRYSALAVIASEDQVFFDHFGFDFEQIEKAIKENKHRKRIRGASTISMQLAKNLFLWSGKSFVRKGLEAYYTLSLELLWSKKRILEEYLNSAELGKGIYGVQAAAKSYYGKNAMRINMSEAATLAAVLPSPKKRNPKRPSGYLLGRRVTIMAQMNCVGGLAYLKEKLD